MRDYIVTAELRNPGVYHTGWQAIVFARTRKEAIKVGRSMAARECYFSREDGPKMWDAKKV